MPYNPAPDNLLTLQQVLNTVGYAVQQALPDRLWLIAEIAQISSSKGHVYLELVQKERGALVAKSRAMVWQSNVASVLGGFRVKTGQDVAPGMNILLCASVTWHSVFGLALTIHAIDGDYTLGEMARQKREVIERLTRENLLDANKALDFPLVPQRIAVISSRAAAGFEDFVHQIESNPGAYKFTYRLFEARMQGDDAERSLLGALDEARHYAAQFDVVVLIRGGGSKTDLHCFDSYALARALATFPLPIITGIGHERDESVADMVAWQRCKTPTAVAEMLIQAVIAFDDHIDDLRARLMRAATMQMERSHHEIDTLARKIQAGALQAISRQAQTLGIIRERLGAAALLSLEREKNSLGRIIDKIGLLDPVNILRRGYSLVTLDGRVVRSAVGMQAGQNIAIRFAEGGASAQITGVENPKELDENAL